MSNYITYCRKSSESEERQVLSIEAQIKEANELAGRLHVASSETLTESQSAKYPGRPVFNEMMKRVSRGQVKGILCWKLDRLARNPIDGSALIWALDQGKLYEIITSGGIFRNNSNDKFLMQLEFGIAKKTVDDLSDNVRRGNKAKLERGWLPGLPPLGYLNEPKERTIVRDPERFPLIRRMWDLLLQGERPSRILKTANEQWGLRTRAAKKIGGKPLTESSLYKMLGNPFYYGLIERKEGVYQGKHESMITEEEYWRAQEILGRRGRTRSQKHQFAFTGLIRCGECGCMITAEEKYKRSGHHYVYYRCTKKRRDWKCTQKYINVKDLESQVCRYLEKIHVPHPLLTIAIEYLRSEAEEEKETYLDFKKSSEKALRECNKKLESLNQMRLRDLIDDEEYLGEKRKLLEEKYRLEGNLKQKENRNKKALELTESTFIFAHQARNGFQEGSLNDKRAVLQAVGSNLVLRNQKLMIDAEKPFVILEKGLVGLQPGISPLEPLENEYRKRKTGALNPAGLSWWARREDVRTRPPSMPDCELRSGRRSVVGRRIYRTRMNTMVTKVWNFFKECKEPIHIPHVGSIQKKAA